MQVLAECADAAEHEGHLSEQVFFLFGKGTRWALIYRLVVCLSFWYFLAPKMGLMWFLQPKRKRGQAVGNQYRGEDREEAELDGREGDG